MHFSDGESTPVHSSGQRPISNWGACNIGKGGWRAPPGGGEIRPPSSTRRASASEESKQVLVDTILVSFRQPLRSALVANEPSVRYELLRSVAGLVDGDEDRQSIVWGKSVADRVETGGRRYIKNNNKK